MGEMRRTDISQADEEDGNGVGRGRFRHGNRRAVLEDQDLGSYCGQVWCCVEVSR